VDVLRNAGRDPVLVPTTGPGTAGGLARKAVDSGAALVLAAGGDGTINEVLEGMAGSAVPLGILPLGTANVLANEMGVPAGIEEAAAAIAQYRPHRIALGRVRRSDNGARYFLLMAGAGLDARIVYEVSGTLKAKLGKLAYWVAGMRMAGRQLEEFPVAVDGRTHLCSFALISKVRNYGGDLQIACDTSLFDDRFEVILFAGRSALRYVKYLAGVALKRVGGMRGVTVLHAKEVALGTSPSGRIYLQVDGEFAGPLPATVETAPDALTLLVPPEYARRFGKQR
jgi:YegS/Rv2252/BmrU family lipid kinase